ncbi:pyrroline-5-carboxylate reductase [Candidatus Auribacterota bacterium]
MVKEKKIAFLGSGNMAEAILKGILLSKITSPKNIICTDKIKERLSYIKRTYKVKTTVKNSEAIIFSDVIIIAVKPQNINEIVDTLKDITLSKKVIISICAGIKIKKIEKGLKEKISVIRVMPNTPALIGEGISALALGKHASKKDMAFTAKLFKAVGDVIELPESRLDAVTALSGSGPAYVFYLLETMLEAAKKLKIPPKDAQKLAFKTFLGATKLAQISSDDLKTLRKKVTSTGGTTEQAIATFEKKWFKKSFCDWYHGSRKKI